MNIKYSDLSYDDGKLTLLINIAKLNTNLYEYAYYVYQDGKIIERVWYQPINNNELKITVTPVFSGGYQIRAFIKYKNNIIFNELSRLLWIDQINNVIVDTTLKEEKVFFNDYPVKYILQESRKKSPYLVISFSGLYSTEFQGGPPVYNHIRTLETLDTNKLFILDSYFNQFCYYVGFGGGQDYERSVISLITSIANRLKIQPENIIATGSSKGGSAALYFSVKYFFGKAIIGAPQVYIATYLDRRANSNSMRSRFNRIMGPDYNYGKLFWNNIILNQVKKAELLPEFYFHVGKGDFHYKQHLKPLLYQLDKKNNNYSLDLEDYTDHSKTGIYFSPFLFNKVQEIIIDNERFLK